MFGLIFYILLGLLYPTQASTTSDCDPLTGTNCTPPPPPPPPPGDGPGGEIGDNPPKP